MRYIKLYWEGVWHDVAVDSKPPFSQEALRQLVTFDK